MNMFKNLVGKKHLFWFSVFLIWAGVIVGILWTQGYQHQSRRSFTDEEMIRIAVHRAMQRMFIRTPRFIPAISPDDSQKVYEPAFIVPYMSVDHFLKENPDCCTINKTNGGKYVDVFGKVFYRDKSGQLHSSDSHRNTSGKILHRYRDGAFSLLSGDAINLDRQYFPNNTRQLP